MIQDIGGYFEWQLIEGKHYHQKAYALNSGRNCYEYILRSKGYKRVYLPKYLCNSMVETTMKVGASIVYYDLDQHFLPRMTQTLKEEEVMILVNYFGMVGEMIQPLRAFYKNVIVDNTHAFFQLPEKDIDTFYSPRKFFGVADGGYVYTDSEMKEKLPQDTSYQRYLYLLKRAEKGAKEGFEDYQKNEEMLGDIGLSQMSILTSKILSSIPYEAYRMKREANAKRLHGALKSYNLLCEKNEEALLKMMLQGPMVYPLWIKKDNLKEYLIQNNIYVATYWKEALKRVEKNHFESDLIQHLVPLPVDQRYSEKDMEHIIGIVKGGI